MTTEAPDPRTFKTWDDAFQYPIPVVRKLETQLRNNAADNREKLRSLVGTSYRDLLSTAETIVDMESRMQSVETNLARVGQACNSRTVERIVRNAAASQRSLRARDEQRFGFASQIEVLRNCPGVVSRLVRDEGRFLLAAKVLVVARLVHGSLSSSSGSGKGEAGRPGIVDVLREKLGARRAGLLRGIDRRLRGGVGEKSVDGEGDVESLVETMCAYSLATSSTPTDVLRHFLHVRMEGVVGGLRAGEGLKESGIRALKLCLQTCQDTMAIFPRRLADALAKLKVQPLIQDADVRALYELNLDVHERWIGEEAKNYTPQPRHNELQRTEAEKMLHQWSRQTIQAFLKGIKTALEDTKELQQVAELRRELIETWILSGSRMAGVKSKNVLDNLRDTMNEHLESIIQTRAQECKTVADEITSTLLSSDEEHTSLSLWTSLPTSTDLLDGARSFKQNTLNTYQGRDGPILRVLASYDRWTDSMLQVKSIVKSMKETRWDDPFSDDVDLVESSDDEEFGADSKQTLLADDDPRLLEDVTQDAVQKALTLLGSGLQKDVERLNIGKSDKRDETVPKMVFILRLVREFNDRIVRLKINEKASAPASPFKSEMIKSLHFSLASHVSEPLLKSYEISLRKATKVKTNAHMLWEGNPPLPVQPSTSAFRMLSALVKKMASLGSDLWAPGGVGVLKDVVGKGMAGVWQEALEDLKDAKTAISTPTPKSPVGAEDKSETDTASTPAVERQEDSNDAARRKEKLKQLLFDILYVQRILSASSKESEELVQRIADAAEVDGAGLARVKKSSGDYARKTYLLFALHSEG